VPFSSPWATVDDDVGAVDVLAVAGAAVWVIGLMWFVANDLLAAWKHHQDSRRTGEHQSRLRPR
jgi:hypothetical protein